MKSTLLKILPAFLLLLTTSCGGGGDNNTNSITYRLIDEGNSSYSQSGKTVPAVQLFVFKDPLDFQFFWSYHIGDTTPRPSMPSINYNEEILVLMDIIEPSTGYSVKITSIIELENKIVVNALKSNPGLNCGAFTVMTQPYQMVAIPLTTKNIELLLTETTYDCN
jgi:hypothetical protein